MLLKEFPINASTLTKSLWTELASEAFKWRALMCASSSLIASFNEASEANGMEASGACGYGEWTDGEAGKEVSSHFSEEASREK